MGRDPVILLNILLGTALGFLSGLGVGGGSLLILWLTANGMEQRIAQGVNLLFFLPAAALSALQNAKKGRVHWSAALPAMVFGGAAAALCAWFALGMDTRWLRRLFGLLLLCTAWSELRRGLSRGAE